MLEYVCTSCFIIYVQWDLFDIHAILLKTICDVGYSNLIIIIIISCFSVAAIK